MVNEEHCGLRYLCRPPLDLEARELVKRDVQHVRRVEQQFVADTALGSQLRQEVEFELAHFAVRDDQEVSAPTGGVDVSDITQLRMERLELRLGVRAVQLLAQVIQEERAQGLEYVLFGGVVLAASVAR